MKLAICLVSIILAVNSLTTTTEKAVEADLKDTEAVHSLLLQSMKQILERDTRAAPLLDPATQAQKDEWLRQATLTALTVGEKAVDVRLDALEKRIKKLEESLQKVAPSDGSANTIVIELVSGPSEIHGTGNGAGYPLPLPTNAVQPPRFAYNLLRHK